MRYDRTLDEFPGVMILSGALTIHPLLIVAALRRDSIIPNRNPWIPLTITLGEGASQSLKFRALASAPMSDLGLNRGKYIPNADILDKITSRSKSLFTGYAGCYAFCYSVHRLAYAVLVKSGLPVF
ncbi:hypothetical protein DFH09DRAFT_1423147 [Mycena vulgaris]|nr:hypothetical protein DFH09DRAFT_1423147 [Mycena vulgaris]